LENLGRRLGERLAEQDYTLISGGGLNVGTATVLGAVTRITARGSSMNDRVRVTAFDQMIEDAEQPTELYTRYRKQMIEGAGFAVFISGNKIGDGTIVRAGGVESEFQLAVQADVIPIAIGASGHVALDIWHRLRNEPVTFFGDRRALPYLERMGPGVTNLGEILDAVFEILRLYDGRRR
jgi:hypothetical protein